MAERFRLPPVITGSSWDNIWGFLWQKPPRGTTEDKDGIIAPVYTNREALSLVRALRKIAGSRFPLWYQFAAVAYGWDPDNDQLDIGQKQADRLYDPNVAVLLMLQIQRITAELDDAGVTGARLELDSDDYDDRAFQEEVQSSLREDGASANAIIPRCKDKKTKRTRFPRAKCGPDGKGPTVKDPITGAVIELPCDNPGDCEPIDPIRGIRKLPQWLVIGAVVVGALYIFAPAALSGVIAGRVARQPRRGRRNNRR